MKKIIYVGSFRFPEKDAASKRVYSIGCILRDLGFTVIFAGGQQSSCVEEKLQYKGFSYYSLGELDRKNGSILEKIQNFFRVGDNTVNWLQEYTKENTVEKIIVYNSSNVFLSKILRFCRRKNIEVICDITEWYDSSNLPGGRYGIVSIDNAIKMHFTYKKITKKILISNYLFDFYDGDNTKNIIVPPLFVERKKINKKVINEYVNILYAGSPAKKDYIQLFLAVYIKNRKILPNLSFKILGISRKEFEEQYGLKVSGNISFYGRVLYSKVLEVYNESHFSFFVRDNKRYANAGFPTKFIESMSQATPVVANITSDLRSYLEDGKNGYVLEDLNEASILKVLSILNNSTTDSYQKMQDLAFRTSEQFYYEKYKEVVSGLVLPPVN